MKYLKKFNESSLPRGVKFSTLMRNVKSHNSEYYSDNDARQQAFHYVDNIERATGQEVSKIEGTCDENNVDLDIKLSDGGNIDIWFGELGSWEYGYKQNSSPGTNEIFKIKWSYNGELYTRTGIDDQFKKIESEVSDFAENEVYYILKDMMLEYDPYYQLGPTHFISLPVKSAHDFYIGDNDKEVYFLSEEDTNKWIESLSVKILKD